MNENKIFFTKTSTFRGELTLEKLKEMEPETIFAFGEGNYPELHKGEDIRWVAVRGGIHDWALYYHLSTYDWAYIKRNGNKSFTDSVIKELVPCDDESFKMYRF